MAHACIRDETRLESGTGAGRVARILSFRLALKVFGGGVLFDACKLFSVCAFGPPALDWGDRLVGERSGRKVERGERERERVGAR